MSRIHDTRLVSVNDRMLAYFHKKFNNSKHDEKGFVIIATYNRNINIQKIMIKTVILL